MATHQISASALIDAPPQELYDIIADYHHGHPRIIPRPPFVSLDVERGGKGEGTLIRVQMRVLGQTQTFRATVTEPEPGRVLVESNDTGYVTTFRVQPHAGGSQARVTISTRLPERTGIQAALERWLMPRMLRPVFVRELGLLAEVAGARVL